MTPSQKEKVYTLINEGLSTDQIVTRLRGAVSKGSVAAIRANNTMAHAPKVFEVEGTFIVEATNREEALRVASTRRVANTRVLNTSLSASRLNATQAAEYLNA